MSSLLEAWRGASVAVVVDAMASGLPAGTVHVLAPDAEVLHAAGAHWSNHGFGLAEAIELGRALHVLPRRLVVLGIEGEDFETGAPVSTTVVHAVERAADLILDTL
jgi:hydrogenase maturation protease